MEYEYFSGKLKEYDEIREIRGEDDAKRGDERRDMQAIGWI